jgi:hypothetical protein
VRIGERNAGSGVLTVETSSTLSAERVMCFLVRAGMQERLGARIGV